MKNRYQPVFILFAVIILCGCAAKEKFSRDGIDLSLTPQRVVAERAALQNVPVLWGGVIISSVNLQDATQFEILAYPLTSEQNPDTGQAPVGRFVALKKGYLELSDYAPGRLMTVRGMLQENRRGRIGENDYIYPLLNINQLYLWSNPVQDKNLQFYFGLGLIF